MFWILRGFAAQDDVVGAALRQAQGDHPKSHLISLRVYGTPASYKLSNLPKSCLSPVSEGKEALAELPCERLAFGVL
ncbi:hypothetical protein SAMN05720469_1535 [Fibrobacter intestinalis]|uniref:Uncharacterized protein n=1 Tax=Fibrobacter intestinalis TaxID=28122 RepID=A0A1M6Z4V7_9BACT|nr:hypothetical protein SAMN05720469_1535 [Fibrobacter intestinalis]